MRWGSATGGGKPPVGPAEFALQQGPFEAGAWVLLAHGRDVFVPRDVPDRIVLGDRRAHRRERLVLRGFEAAAFQPFELDAHGIVVAVLAPAVARGAGMPGPVVAAHELQQRAVAADEEVRR